MGKIFSPSELSQRAYPQPGAHQIVAEELMDDVRHFAHNMKHPLAAMIYGSVLAGADNRTSDVDFLVVHETPEAETAEVAFALGGLALQKQVTPHVPVSVNLIARAHMPYRYSLQDPLFTENLTLAYKITPAKFILGNPVEGMPTIASLPNTHTRHTAAITTTHAYLHERMARIVEAYADSADDPVDALKIAVNLPSTLGRKMARVIEINQALLQGTSSETTTIGLYNRHEALTAFSAALRIIDDRAALIALESLAGIASEYARTLDETIGGSVTLDSYGQWPHKHTVEATQASLQLCTSSLRYLRTIDHYRTLPKEHPPMAQTSLAAAHRTQT